MRQIGRVAGIPIRLHPTFLLLLVLVLLSAEPLAVTVTLFMVFASVTVHELAHGVVAQRRGIVVRDIVLLPIGGVSELERLPERPKDQLEVALAGPATSAAIGLLALALTAGTGGSLIPIDLVHGALLHRLGWLNLTLAAFNLLPALPLDGGRVLRALLAPRVGELRATLTAARIGRSIAIAMIGLGLLVDLWLVIVGVFVLFGASAERTSAVVKERVVGLVARDLMRPVENVTVDEVRAIIGADVITVSDTEPLEEAVAEIATAGVKEAVVVREGRPVGVLHTDDVRRLLVEGRGPASARS